MGLRILLALLAALLVAGFGLLARNNAVGTAAAQRIVDGKARSDAEWERAMDDLRDAELLDPSTDWSITRARYLLLRDKREAIAVADSVLRDEPDNLDAWWVISRAARDVAPARLPEAIAEIRRLNPPQ